MDAQQAAALRRAWTETVDPAEYELHMTAVGQSAACGRLLDALIDAPPAAAVLIAGAGPGQWLSAVHLPRWRAWSLTATDIRPEFLARFAERLPARCLLDDLESSRLAGTFDTAAVSLVLEHIHWTRGVASLARLARRAAVVVIQENPAALPTAVTPGRTLPPTLEVFRDSAHPRLLDPAALLAEFSAHGFALDAALAEPVADSKVMRGFRFLRA
ncbi:MAG: class I SAM-dependent methyltransferase [Bryobacter sp.]|jgi:hypothetical protein|nr:class I SAM-dependent methyltransferase [Bryobacter sp.]